MESKRYDNGRILLPAEWETQSGIQLTWPHAATDWAYMLDEVETCFVAIAREIAARELLLIVTPERERVEAPWRYYGVARRRTLYLRFRIQRMGAEVCCLLRQPHHIALLQGRRV